MKKKFAQAKQELEPKIVKQHSELIKFDVGQNINKNIDQKMMQQFYVLQQELVRHWQPPVGIIGDCTCLITTQINWQGKIEDIVIDKQSGVLMFDIAARSAMLAIDLPRWSGQFNISIQLFNGKLSKKKITHLFKENKPLAVFLNYANSETMIEWRVYDTMKARMVKGKKYTKRGNVSHGWAHNIADALWPVLTGQQGFFSTKIAYAKKNQGTKQ